MSTDTLSDRTVTAAARRRSDWRIAVRVFRRNRLATVGLLLLVGLVGIALAAPLLAARPPVDTDLGQKLLPPGWGRPFGTDHFGRDVLSRLLYGARISLGVGLAVIAI